MHEAVEWGGDIMIDRNDLYDIFYVLTLMRSDIENPLNKTILLKLVCVLEKQELPEDNQVRKAIATVEGLDEQKWFFVYHNNVYTTHRLLKNPNTCRLIADLCLDIVRALEDREFERAYDLIDACHMLPEIIADNRLSVPKSFFKTGLALYRRKWDRHYRTAEERTYKQYC